MFDVFRKNKPQPQHIIREDDDYLILGASQPEIKPRLIETIKKEPIISEPTQTHTYIHTYSSDIPQPHPKLSSIQMSIELKEKIRQLKGSLTYEDFIRTRLFSE